MSGPGALKGLRCLMVSRMLQWEKQWMMLMEGGRSSLGKGGETGGGEGKKYLANAMAFSLLELTVMVVPSQRTFREGIQVQV